jgi:hypothetical protein
MKKDTKIILEGMVQVALILRNLCIACAKNSSTEAQMYSDNTQHINELYKLINQTISQ